MTIAIQLRRWLGGAPPLATVECDPLVVRLREGELSAVADAFDLHREEVYAFARRLVGDDASAEDLVQEVFLALPCAVSRFRGEASLRTLLISMAINHARNHIRAATRRRRAMENVALEPLQHAASSPEDDSRRRQLATALTRALDSLPLDQRVAFVLCEVEERTSAEAAILLNVPEGTVRTRLFHARRKLRERLEAEGIR